MSKLPPTDKCPHCGNERRWDLWTVAHFNEWLTTECAKEECGKKYSIRNGKVSKRA